MLRVLRECGLSRGARRCGSVHLFCQRSARRWPRTLWGLYARMGSWAHFSVEFSYPKARVITRLPAQTFHDTMKSSVTCASQVLAFFTRPGTSNGPTEAINGRLEHLRGSALGFRNITHYIARCLLESGGFRPVLHSQLR